jgi:peptidoglycan hydrolase-like protein with peptidoglycan-binding domain
MSNPLLELVARGESGAAGYNAYNRGTYSDEQGRSRIRGPAGSIDFTAMTLGQIQDRQHLPEQDENRLFAVGRYQIIPTTMAKAAEALNLSRDEPFTPQLQDRIFSEHLIMGKRPAIHDYIVGKPGVTLEAAQRDLAREWASFGDPDKQGRSHYPPPNHASITLEQSANALNQMRQEYQAHIGQGLAPSDAWRAITASDGQPAHRQESSTTSFPGHESLHQGSRSPAVSDLQTRLNDLSYRNAQGHALATDGHFGPATRHAVEAFQRDHGLTPDGIVGRGTLSALSQQPDLTRPSPAQPAARNDALRQGAHGPDVADLQSQLAQLGYTDNRGRPLPSDGNFGLATRHVVEAFQHDHGLTPDGIVGRGTLNRLQDVLSQQQHPARQAAVQPAAPQINDSAHRDHEMFRQAQAGVHRLDAERGRSPDLHSEQLSGALVAAARKAGLERIDSVWLSDDGSKAFAVQGRTGSPEMKFASVSTVLAIHTSIAQSTQTLEQVEQHNRIQIQPPIQQDMPQPQVQRGSPAMVM